MYIVAAAVTSGCARVYKGNEYLHLIQSWTPFPSDKDDYETVPYPTKGSFTVGYYNFSKTSKVKSTGRSYTAYIAILNEGLPDSFSFELPTGGM